MESAYWPGNEKELVATELKRHGGMRYMMSGPWNETSEYYEEIIIQQLALLTASRDIKRGIAFTLLSQQPCTPATTRKRWDAPAH